MDLDQGYWIQVLDNNKRVDLLVKRESRSASFDGKVVPYLWRADPSFMSSVTGYSYVTKCSNILQDIGAHLRRHHSYLKIVDDKHSSLFCSNDSDERKEVI